MRVPTGQHDGASFGLTFRNIGITDPEELYFRYYVRFNDTWQKSGDGEIGKFPGFDAAYGTIAGHGCNPSNGYNGWSARMMNVDRGSQHQLGFYTYHVDMPERAAVSTWSGPRCSVARNRIGGGSTPSSEVPPVPQNLRIVSSGAE
jgi:hypothetical protein